MNRTRTFLLLLSLIACSTACEAQRLRQRELLRHLSTEDLNEYLLFRSQQTRSKAIGAAIAGPVLTGVGLYLLHQEQATDWRRESSTKMYGAVVSSIGFLVSVSSIPLFIAAGKSKHEAMLLLKAGSTAVVHHRLIPEAGLQLNF